MKSDNAGGGSSTFLSFLVGGLLVAVVGLGIFIANGGHFGSQPEAKISVEVPKL